MKLCFPGRPKVVAFGFFLVIFCLSQVSAESIRLRNATIQTGPTAESLPGVATLAAAIPGKERLILVEFRGPLEEPVRERLRRAGLEPLRFVPEKAYVVRLNGLTLAEVKRMPFVAWAGPYRPEYKVHAAVRQWEIAATRAPGAVAEDDGAVTVLLAPGVSAKEIAAVREQLGEAGRATGLRSGTIVRGRLRPGQLDTLAANDAVLWVEPAARMQLYDEVSSKLVAGDGGPNELFSRALGYDGAGVTVAVADSGLNNGDSESMHPDLAGRTPTFFFYGNLFDAADEHSHGTHVTGIIAGDGATGETDENGALYGLGVAPGASIVTQRIFDGAGGYQAPPSFEKLTRDATRAGAVIGSNSWGDDTQGRYDLSAMEFDELVRDADALRLGNQEYIVEFSAGNAGPGTRTVGSPAVAKNVIASGASGNDRPDFFIYADGPDAVADFSSRGPCEDGRIKPDVVAPGAWIASLQSYSASDMYAWYPISPNYQFQGGTSQAGPHVSGAAAVFVQFYREQFGTTPSPALVKAALINSAYDLFDEAGTDPTPNMDEGWGCVDLTALVDPERGLLLVDQEHLLGNGQSYEQRVVVTRSDEALKVTLTYTDVPGFPGALPALVNDLDLEVVAPDGIVYRGNQFDRGISTPDPLVGDRINNVEGVYLSSPVVGEYQVRVRVQRVAEDARTDTAGLDQDFALVCSGPLARPGDSVIAADRRAYRAPDQIHLTVIDRGLSAPVEVLAVSGSEPAGERVQLTLAGSQGVFTGAVSTVTGAAMADGQLQVAHGDFITLSMTNAAGQPLATGARADLRSPVLSSVRSTNVFGQMLVDWTTDEPADAAVIFGPSPASLTNVTRIAESTTAHQVALAGLERDQTYYYYVVSRDEAGNAGTNNNGGALYTFLVAPNRPVLLVDEYLDLFFDVPPLEGYTSALDAAGVSYDIWEVAQQGEPSVEVLKSYRALIWRVPELTGVWSAAERAAIRTYMASGGALFVASMEVLSRLETAGDTDFIRQVLQVESYTVDPLSTGASYIRGSEFSPIGKGLSPEMDYTPYEIVWGGLLGPDISDTIVPANGAVSMLMNDADETVGLHWVGTNSARLVFFSFPLDAVVLTPESQDRVELVSRVVDFLLPDLGGGSLWLSSSSYGLPARVEVELASAERAGDQTLEVSATSGTAPDGIRVTLYETARRGFFRGYFELERATNTPSAGKLQAVHGDTLEIVFDSGGSSSLVARAGIDTQVPAIADVVAEPDYIEAVVSWNTTEPTDALVQFGESALLGRTAYNAGPSTSHALTLPGLAPDRVYYYRVVSRDLAGNTATDDDGGQLHTLRTLAPLVAPWSDDMDLGAADWTVVDSEGSQPGWQLGIPSNGLVTGAHSSPNAWGTSLTGQPADLVETFLVSPAVFLTNGNVATLTFWHAYEFLELTGFEIELAEVLLIANNGPAIPIAQLGDSSGGWVQEEIDLTPYMGKMIYLAWHYFLFSLESVPRPGWVVDDVSITVQSVAPGTIEISNNLAQASFVLSGPLYRKASGTYLEITNAPPGTYLLEYGEVPNYLTPPPQSQVLAAGGKLQFTGTYQPVTTEPDTDGDGMSDPAELIAGTDPGDPSSVFRVSAVETPTVIGLSCSTVAGRSYRVLSSADAVTWQAETDWLPGGGSSPLTFTVPKEGSGGGRLYRFEVRAN